jgi:hypothetical protein
VKSVEIGPEVRIKRAVARQQEKLARVRPRQCENVPEIGVKTLPGALLQFGPAQEDLIEDGAYKLILGVEIAIEHALGNTKVV